MCSRKDYVAVAKIINDAQPLPGSTPTAATITRCSLENVAQDLAKYFATDNARFDRARFLAACGVQS